MQAYWILLFAYLQIALTAKVRRISSTTVEIGGPTRTMQLAAGGGNAEATVTLVVTVNAYADGSVPTRSASTYSTIQVTQAPTSTTKPKRTITRTRTLARTSTVVIGGSKSKPTFTPVTPTFTRKSAPSTVAAVEVTNALATPTPAVITATPIQFNGQNVQLNSTSYSPNKAWVWNKVPVPYSGAAAQCTSVGGEIAKIDNIQVLQHLANSIWILGGRDADYVWVQDWEGAPLEQHALTPAMPGASGTINPRPDVLKGTLCQIVGGTASGAQGQPGLFKNNFGGLRAHLGQASEADEHIEAEDDDDDEVLFEVKEEPSWFSRTFGRLWPF